MNDSNSGETHVGADDVTIDHGGRKPQRFALDMLDAGDVLGRYIIINRLGEGAMGVVYRAYDPRLGREVALKRLRAGGIEATARMVREAHAMAKLSHPNVVAVYDVEDEAEDSRIVMELVDGQTLCAWSKAHTHWRELLRVYLLAGEGLAAAHAEGLVHRDFKPSNVLVSTSGEVKVVDFGIAKGTLHPSKSHASVDRSSFEASARGLPDSGSRDSLEADLTAAGTVMGTPMYMAPEQAQGEGVDARSDQYAFCVALWRALTGEAPFRSGSSTDMTARKLRARPTLPSGIRLPRDVVRALERGLRPAADDRWPSMRALLDVLKTASRPRRTWPWALGGTALVGTIALSSWVGAELDGFAQAWIAQRRDVCEASVRGSASEALIRRRLDCLERARAAHTPLQLDDARERVRRDRPLSRPHRSSWAQRLLLEGSTFRFVRVVHLEPRCRTTLSQRRQCDDR